MNQATHIFNRKLLHSRLNNYNAEQIQNLDKKIKIIQRWKYSIENSDLSKTKEKSVQGDFLTDFFTNILDYKKRYGNNLWNITQEQKTLLDGTTSDGALGFFTQAITDIRVAIELKDAKTDLDKKQKGRESKVSPVEQAFSYAPKSGKKCNWVIVSNFIEIRLYHSSNQLEYERFLITELDYEEEFKRFYYLLCCEHLIDRDGKSLLEKMYEENEEEQQNISKMFYKDYKTARLNLFEGLKKMNPNHDDLLLFEKSQKLIDRFIFICFCEDKGLLPENTFQNVIKAAKLSFDVSDCKVWHQLRGLFYSIDKGNAHLNINKFNGGLFQQDTELDNLVITDDLFKVFEKLSSYDFDTDLNVNILGHIFEQSISDIEEIKAEIKGEQTDKKQGKRKKDGIFYTPEYITNYIVEQVIGGWLEERMKEFGGDNLPHIPESKLNMTASEKKSRNNAANRHIEFWNKYKNALSSIKVLDSACGSGAFLNKAFDYLYKEGQRVNACLSELQGGQMSLFDLDKHILKNNLFGVDLNKESVEITKLSLWLKTANKNDALTSLDDNIKCGNSIIEDAGLAEGRAFIWKEEFKEILDNGGFDVVIGNPPYVRQEYLGVYKDYLRVNYKVFNHAADLFAYFYEKSLYLLKANGIIGFISNTFAKSNAGTELRGFLQDECKILSYTDFTDMQIFEGATTYPIIFVGKKMSVSSATFKYLKVDKESINNLYAVLNSGYIEVNQSKLDKSNWIFKSQHEDTIRAKISVNPCLREVFGKCYFGIKTGLNEAFIIDDTTRKALITATPEADILTRPLLEGKDLAKWSVESADKWLLLFPKGWTKERVGSNATEEEGWNYIKSNYTGVAEYLEAHQEKALKRCDKGDFWWELRSCDYYHYFDSEKIIWPNLQSFNKFSLDTSGFYLVNPTVILPTSNKVLLGILNSKLAWFFLKDICPVRSGGFIEVQAQYVEQLPIKLPENENLFVELVDKIIDLTKSQNQKIIKFNRYIEQIYKPVKFSDKLEDFYLLGFDQYIEELKKQKVILNDKSKFELMELFEQEKGDISSVKSQIQQLSAELDQWVYKLYELTDAEIQIVESL